MLKTAKSWGDEPLDIIGQYLKRKLKKREKRHFNALLKRAYQILEDETCNGCGVPSWLGHTADNRVQFKAMKYRCESCAEKDAAQNSKAVKLGPGETIFVKPEYYNEDGDLVEGMMLSRREALERLSDPDPVMK